MYMTPGNAVIRLAKGKRLAFWGARDVHFECAEGMVWLTVEGQPGDFLLASGERLCIKSNGLAVIQGLPSGSVRLAGNAPESIHQGNRFAWPWGLFAVHMIA